MENQSVCHICGSSPCYLICPMADPFHGDQAAEHDDHESNACFDDVRERFAGSEVVDNADDDLADGECTAIDDGGVRDDACGCTLPVHHSDCVLYPIDDDMEF